MKTAIMESMMMVTELLIVQTLTVLYNAVGYVRMHARMNAGHVMKGNAVQSVTSAGHVAAVTVRMSVRTHAGNAREKSANHSLFVKVARAARKMPGRNMNWRNATEFVMLMKILKNVKTAKLI